MQGFALAQRQQLRAIPVQIQANAILGMNLLELNQFIETESMENPALSLREGSRCPGCGFLAAGDTCPVCGTSRMRAEAMDPHPQDEHGYLERAFAAADPDATYDPFRTVASQLPLVDHLKQQARLALGGRRLRIAEYIVDMLDDDGYLRESLFEIAEQFATAVPEVEEVLALIQTFDPPGVAARNLRECLLIQLRSLCADGPALATAERMLTECWDDFSRAKLKSVAARMEVPVEVVQEACGLVRERLTPRPTALYRAPFSDLAPRETAAVAPDVVLHRRGDSFVAEAVDVHGSLLDVDETYDELYSTIKRGGSHLSDEDCRHIREHVERVKCILEAIGLRKKTVTRVAGYLADYQEDFLNNGPSRLRPLRQKDVAQALGVHESTVCRALAGKHCKLPSGEVISFEVFFDSALPVRNMISQLIARASEPISDGEIALRLAEQGVTIARRTVAKYREQLKVLPYQLRAA